MVQDRKEPTMSGIKPERDEIASHQDRIKRSGSGASGAAASSSSGSGRGGSAAVFALILALIGVGAAGFGIWQMQVTQQQLAEADARIAELEARINLTSTESSQSVSEIQETLEWADSEIRKLWGVAYDTNRENIEENTSRLNSVEEIAGNAAQTAESAAELGEELESGLASVRSQSNEQQLVLSRANETLETQEEQVRELADQTGTLEAQVEELDNSLSTRVAENEEAIEAIDAFRRTVTQDIQELKESNSSPSGSSP